VQGSFLALNDNFHALGGILHLALQPFILSQTIDKGSETHTLDPSGENKT
jgi:hypothetical protein